MNNSQFSSQRLKVSFWERLDDIPHFSIVVFLSGCGSIAVLNSSLSFLFFLRELDGCSHFCIVMCFFLVEAQWRFSILYCCMFLSGWGSMAVLNSLLSCVSFWMRLKCCSQFFIVVLFSEWGTIAALNSSLLYVFWMSLHVFS